MPDYLAKSIIWNKTTNAEFPFEAVVEQHKLTIRLNDFPVEPFYTLFVDEQAIVDFDNWPENWQRL